MATSLSDWTVHNVNVNKTEPNLRLPNVSRPALRERIVTRKRRWGKDERESLIEVDHQPSMSTIHASSRSSSSSSFSRQPRLFVIEDNDLSTTYDDWRQVGERLVKCSIRRIKVGLYSQLADLRVTTTSDVRRDNVVEKRPLTLNSLMEVQHTKKNSVSRLSTIVSTLKHMIFVARCLVYHKF